MRLLSLRVATTKVSCWVKNPTPKTYRFPFTALTFCCNHPAFPGHTSHLVPISYSFDRHVTDTLSCYNYCTYRTHSFPLADSFVHDLNRIDLPRTSEYRPRGLHLQLPLVNCLVRRGPRANHGSLNEVKLCNPGVNQNCDTAFQI